MAQQGTPGRVHLGNSGYTQEKSDFDGHSGDWAHCSAKKKRAFVTKTFQQANAGIVAGTTPTSQGTGKLHDYDQLFVEMGALLAI